MYYIYRHIRVDRNEPFYIGIGTLVQGVSTFRSEHNRAYDRSHRSMFWKRIASKTNFNVEILLYSEDRNEILSKEIEFINLYGRKDIGTGTLVNLNSGGLCGVSTLSTQSKLKWSNSQNKVIVYQYSSNGEFVAVHNSLSEAVLTYSNSKSVCALKKCCSDSSKSLYGYKWFYKYQGENIDPFVPYVTLTSKPVSCFDITTGLLIRKYSSIKEAARDLNLNTNLIRRNLAGKVRRVKSYFFT